ncbi:multiple epidermal growth factor-like domains protein 10 [Bombyx mori]|uniref:EB domain-containing protein n=1 Tax=Bombyx mori TaxID=7091 RepID=A0A8R2AMV6_BOMMO|nr:multiple epidermal growth factor-like domains protein 10 [Bombyx mori]
MWSNNFLFIFACSLQLSAVLALWSCSEDDDCSSLAGSVCRSGSCACPHGHQSVLGGSLCATVAPYHTSACVESHQCSRLFTSFECRRSGNERDGKCFCQEDHHYFRGRCWPIAEYGATCTRHEECLSVMRDPFSLRCDGTCVCATGYYSRQRGECRKIAAAVGEGCVLDEDCQFPGGACNVNTFRCYDVNAPPTEPPPAPPVTEPITEPTTAEPGDRPTTEEPEIIVVEGQFCDLNNPCPSPYQCSKFSSCVCPVGYYGNEAGTLCLAELGSPSTSEQCVGLLAEVRDGVCTCPANFFFDENMRDCVKVTRRITDSCVSDMNCFTFGSAARCGPPQQPWQLRSCECIPELAVWDADRNICRFFAGIGETCEVDSDCLAGELEIQCVKDEAGQGYCTCPEDLIAVDGLCVTSGLVLGEACQVSLECSGTENAVCTDGVCSCNTGYQQVDDFCAPVIGGTCSVDSDCVIPNTACFEIDNSMTCQCKERFVAYDDECWPNVDGFQSACNVTAQCTQALGNEGVCLDGACACVEGFHHRGGRCWPITGLFEVCNRDSQCFLGDLTERVVCRNSLCQCDFSYPYSEELHTCTSSASKMAGSLFIMAAAILYLYSNKM